jgi:5-(aminomethyl)-3-furanmethanol phosphate kinase
MANSDIHVVKLGGSLLDLPDLVERFDAWRAAELGPRGLLVVGGGAAADVVRDFDKAFRLGEVTSHWLAIRAMQFNAHCVAAVLRDVVIAGDQDACDTAWRGGKLAIVDPLDWLSREAAAEGVHVPHRWTFTSDSVAAHVATRIGAAKLTLLKSALPPSDCGLACAAGLGIVDEDFPAAAAALPGVELVNLRSQPFGRCALK